MEMFMAGFEMKAPSVSSEKITEDGFLGKKGLTKESKGIESIDLSWKDGMKTEEEIKSYDPISNPINNTMSGKPGHGTSSLTNPYGCDD